MYFHGAFNERSRNTLYAERKAGCGYKLHIGGWQRYKREGEPSADFINFVAYGAAAEFAEKYFKKGTKLVVVARCQTRTYTNNEGKKVYVTEFIVEDQEFAESKRAAGGEPETEKDGFMQMPEGEELPFN